MGIEKCEQGGQPESQEPGEAVEESAQMNKETKRKQKQQQNYA